MTALDELAVALAFYGVRVLVDRAWMWRTDHLPRVLPLPYRLLPGGTGVTTHALP